MIYLAKHKLCCLTAPKVASTSLKRFFFEIENGHSFKPFEANGRKFHIHDFYRKNKILPKDQEKITRITVVRDPVKRFLSVFRNRVVHHRELSKEFFLKHPQSELPVDPTLDTFIEHFEEYVSLSYSIKHHSNPLVEFIGREPALYSKIFNISELDDLENYVNRICGTSCKIPLLQRGGPRVRIDMLSDEQIKKIRRIYGEDYEIWGKYF
jgi:hypothetical protein